MLCTPVMHNRLLVTSQICARDSAPRLDGGRGHSSGVDGQTSVTAETVRPPKETVVFTISSFAPLIAFGAQTGERLGRAG